MEAGPSMQLCAISIGGVNIWLYVACVILIICSAYFSASETAFSTVNHIRLKSLADNKVREQEEQYILPRDTTRLCQQFLLVIT